MAAVARKELCQVRFGPERSPAGHALGQRLTSARLLERLSALWPLAAHVDGVRRQVAPLAPCVLQLVRCPASMVDSVQEAWPDPLLGTAICQ